MQTDLKQLFESSEDTYFLHNRYYVEGVVMGACVCPEIPLPDVWLPWTINIQSRVKDTAQADRVFEQLFEYFRHVLTEMRTEHFQLPDYIEFQYEGDNFALESFFQGLLVAHHQSEKVWQHAWQKMQVKSPELAPKLAKKLKHCLMMFSTFSDVNAALDKAKARGQIDFGNNLQKISASLPLAMQQYIEISGALVDFLPNQFETFIQD
ncbi:UPF0149 family protein [Glaciecola sp. 1036]|uniref:UPF0149 family protein n=1 Tax=Alteromonadaceae TaxID=72275 RepID=UPI003CFFC39C